MNPDEAVGTTLAPVLIASICHEANRQYCESIGDFSQATWEGAPEWQRESALAGVQAILEGRTTKPSDSHESWLEQKKADGWKYGPKKDPEKKEHPCFVPYDELPWEQKRKDHLFFAIVKALTEPMA